MVSRRAAAWAAILLLGWAGTAVAIDPPGGAGRIEIAPRDVSDEGHLVLADGTIVILAGLVPATSGLRAAVSERLSRRFARLDDATPDRYRRVRAQVVSDGGWLQAELVAAGLALVGADPAARPYLRALMVLEDQARRARRGGWGDGSLRVLDAAALGFVPEGFHVLQGQVDRIESRGGASVIIFVGPARRILSVVVPAAPRAELRRAGIAMTDIPGRRLRVRGHVAWRGGLTIEATIAEQFEFDP